MIDGKGGSGYIAAESWRTLNAQKAGQCGIFRRHLKIWLVARPDGIFSNCCTRSISPAGDTVP